MDKETLVKNFLNASHRHDWDYDYSDDHGVWQKGHSQYRRMWDAFLQIEALDPALALETWNSIAPSNFKRKE